MEQQMKELIKKLGYTDKVAEDFIKMVNGWKDRQGMPVLISWEQRLNQAQQEYIRGKISKGQFAKVEKSIVKKLSQRIQKEIGLADDTKYKQVTCLKYSHVVHVLGRSIGLSLKAIREVELMTRSQPRKNRIQKTFS